MTNKYSQHHTRPLLSERKKERKRDKKRDREKDRKKERTVKEGKKEGKKKREGNGPTQALIHVDQYQPLEQRFLRSAIIKTATSLRVTF